MRKAKMKQPKHQKHREKRRTDTSTERRRQKTMNESIALRASTRERAKRHAPETISFQHFGCVLEVHQGQVQDPATAVDTAK